MAIVTLRPKEASYTARLLTREALKRMGIESGGNIETKPQLKSLFQTLGVRKQDPMPIISDIVRTGKIDNKKLSSKQRQTFAALASNVRDVSEFKAPRSNEVLNYQANPILLKAKELYNKNPLVKDEVIKPVAVGVNNDFENMWRTTGVMPSTPNVGRVDIEKLIAAENTLFPIAGNFEDVKKLDLLNRIIKRNWNREVSPLTTNITSKVSGYNEQDTINDLLYKTSALKDINVAPDINVPSLTSSTFAPKELALINEAYKASGGNKDILEMIVGLAKGWEGTPEELAKTASLL